MLTLRNRKGIHELAEEVVARWVFDDPAIPTRQALRALHTWSRPERLRSRRVARSLARELLPPTLHAELLERAVEALHERRPLDPVFADVPAPVSLPPLRHGEAKRHLTYERLLDELKLGRGVITDEDEIRQATDDDVRQWRERHPEAFRSRAAPPNIAAALEAARIVGGIARLCDVGGQQLEQARSSLAPLADAAPGACRALLAALAR